MARRKRVDVHINHERWLVSYADFITLLFAFFVVMYSVSSVNEDKFRVLSDSMVTAFQAPKASLDPVQIGELVRSPQVQFDSANDISAATGQKMRSETPADTEPQSKVEDPDDSFSQQVLDKAEVEIDGIAQVVESNLEEAIDEDLISVKRNKFWLEVEIKSKLLFPSGGSQLIPASIPLLVELSNSFQGQPNRIHIEGFTDDKPIRNQVFPSNWELSAARAAAVVRLFEGNGIEPSRLSATGYGEYQPIAENIDDEGRAKNRRVVIVVMASLEGRQNERIYEFDLLKNK